MYRCVEVRIGVWSACRYVAVRVGVWRRADACRCVWLQVHARSVELSTASLRWGLVSLIFARIVVD